METTLQSPAASDWPEYLADECPQCESSTPVYLGSLGRTEHYRCRTCGWTFSQ